MHLSSYLSSGHEFTADELQLAFKFRIINYFMAIAIIFGLLVGILGDTGVMQIGAVQPKANYLFAAFNVLLIFLLRKSKANYRFVAWLQVFSTYILILLALLNVPNDELRIAWFYVVAYVAYMMLGTRAGIFYSVLISITIVVCYALVDLQITETGIFTSILALIVLSLLTRAYANQIETYEQQLKSKNNLLLQNIAELDEALDTAKQANQVKSLFLANMSHEIRTPMHGVLSMAQVLKTTALDEQQQSYLESIDRSGNILLNLIDDLLDISKIESGTFSLSPASFNSQLFIRDILDTVEPLFENGKIDFNVHIADSLPASFIADETRLKQIILNLVSNAAKYTDKGHVNLAIDGNRDKDRFHLSIQVEDTGVGIPADKQQYIFENFQQLSAERIANRGVGLGLSICKRIVDAMHGNINVRSVEGMGSQFIVDLTIPYMDDADNSHIVTTPKQLQQLQILIAEDDSISRLAIQTMLANHGHQITVTENGLQALEALRNDDYDAILLDIHMPLLNGLDTTRQIKQLKLTSAPVIGMTASVMSNERDSYFNAGMDALIEKPINFDYLMEIIDEVLLNAARANDSSENDH